MTDKQPDGLAAGRVYNFILTLPHAEAAAMRALTFAEQLKIVQMDGADQDAAINALMQPKAASAKKEIKNV
jgi:ribosomal protein S12 methylthiotransferase accessory factor YcaO